MGNRTVVVGEVLDAYSSWNDDGTFILTDFRILPTEVVKGDPNQGEMTVTLMGGTVGDLTTVIVAGAQLVPGRAYVLFLNRQNLPGFSGALTVRDHSQGVFDIVDTVEGLRAFSQAQAHLVPDGHGLIEPPGGAKGLPLDNMLDEIRRLAAERGIQ